MIWRYGIIHLLFLTIHGSDDVPYSPHHKDSDLAMDFYRCDQDVGVWCDNGLCTTKEQTCDGKYDCADGSDENVYCLTSSKEGRCQESKGFFCREDLKCIPRQKVCDEEDDCESGADEKFCTDLINSPENSTCKGFVCRNGQCISKLWACDGHFDCLDESDEDVDLTCKHAHLSHTINDGLFCVESTSLANRTYKCIDGSFCLPAQFMCNGLDDCKDGSDEGPFCKRWFTMCENTTCGDGATCSSERYGPTCICPKRYAEYNVTTKKCVDVNECNLNRPQCSQICDDVDGTVKCSCEKGYIEDADLRRCFAPPEPSGLLFYKTLSGLGYMEMKTGKNVVIKNVTKAQGPVYDGKYFYYVRDESGKQAIMKGELDNFKETEKVLYAVGIEKPHYLALDWLGGHLYFSDYQHGAIYACQTDGLRCTRVPAVTKLPMFLTLDVINGNMYWVDLSKCILTAKMDGSHTKMFLDNVDVRGMAIDPPNHRLYYLTKRLNAINLKIKNPQPYVIYTDQTPDIWTAIPRGVAIFENSIYWTDTGTFSVKITEKMSSVLTERHHATRHTFLQLHSMPHEIFIYHPLLMPEMQSPCDGHNCSHFCFITSSTTKSCGCPEGMTLNGDYNCTDVPGYYPEYLVIGSKNTLTRVQYNTISNLDTEATVFDIGVVRALAFDNIKDRLFIYDGQRKIISYTNMSDFTLGSVHPLVDRMMDDVTDLQYDYSTDNLYFLNSGHSTIEVYSLRSMKRAVLRTFSQRERLINFCIMPKHGKMLVAIDNGDLEAVTIDSFNLDGTQRHTIIANNLKGPRITLDYFQHQDLVYISDEGNGYIDFMSPEGKGRETYRQLDAPITALAVTSPYVFYTSRSSALLYWTPLSETAVLVRSVLLGIFPNNSHLHIVATNSPPDQNDTLLTHPCLTNHKCSDVCVQSPPTDTNGYRCVCAPGLIEVDNVCVPKVECEGGQLYCFRSEKCIWKEKMCDGVEDCRHGEDELGCNSTAPDANNICFQNEKLCNGACIHSDEPCVLPSHKESICNNMTHFVCDNMLCLARALVCDGVPHCVDEGDESTAICLTPCADYEYSCGKGQCIRKTWVCDGDEDCSDGSDEIGCPNGECPRGKFRCGNWECIDMSMRCDGKIDCNDLSDEKDCQEEVVGFGTIKECEDWEYTCELNHTICLPSSAKCNSVEECPGGTDEKECADACTPLGLFACSHEKLCLNYNKVCDWKTDCLQGNDELEVNCRKVHRQPHKFTPIHSPAECLDGFPCGSGQCIEWDQVCDQTTHCVDGADEGAGCATPCTPDLNCSDICRPTPTGPRCLCPFGRKPDHHHCSYRTCKDDVCSQMCQNTRHTYVCQCYDGYSLRSDKHTCKANNGPMELLYVPASKSSVLSNKHRNSRLDSTLFKDPSVVISDIGVLARSDLLYIATEHGELIIVKGSNRIGSITNVGRPKRLAVEWITGNVYLADNSLGENYMRVCNFERKTCAKLQKLPRGGDVLSMAIDTRSTLIFYCVSNDVHHTIWSSTLSGQKVRELAIVNNCTGLTVESYKKLIYIAENDPDHIMVVDYDGVKQRKLAATNPHVRSPQNLAIFEDYIYFLRSNSRDMARCLLFGPKTCEMYLSNMFDTSLFAIKHEAMQRDVHDACLDMSCSDLCVLDEEKGAKCVCQDGSLSDVCSETENEEMPIIQDLRPKNQVFVIIGWIVAIVIAFMLAVYFCVRRGDGTQAQQPAAYAAFRANPTGSQLPGEEVSLHVEGQQRPTRRGYQNPFEFVPNLFRRTFRRSGPRRPVFNPVPTQTQSDTISGISSLPAPSKSTPEVAPSMIPSGPSTESFDSINKRTEKNEGKGDLDLLMSPTDDTSGDSKESSKKASTSEEGSVESVKGLLKPSSNGSSDGN